MRIAEVRINGFRSLGSVGVSLRDYTCLIGKNDSGKSSFLRALQLLFDSELTPSESDICKIEGYTDQPFIEATLSECIGHENITVDGNIKLRRIFTAGKWIWEVNSRVPASPFLKDMQKGSLLRPTIENEKLANPKMVEAIHEKLSELQSKGKISAETSKIVFQFLSDKGLVEWEPGWAPLPKEKLSSLVTVVMLEAGMRGEEEITDGGKSVFTRVGGLLLREATRNHPEMIQAVDQLNEVMKNIVSVDDNGNSPVAKVNSFQRILQEEISRFDESITTKSQLMPPKPQNLEFTVRLDISDQWVNGIDKMGHGFRRSVVFAMLRTHRRVRLEVEPAEATESAPETSPLYLFLVEEPELYLHPQAERRRMEELQELAAGEGTQVVLCTHSAIFVDLLEYRGILRFSRHERGSTKIHHWTGEPLDRDQEKHLSRAYAFNENRAAMLFAKHVILTEGQTETIMVPWIAKKLGCYDPDVEVVDCAGNQNVNTYQRILQGFGIPYVAWMDRDDDAPSRNRNNTPSLRAIAKVRREMDLDLGKLIILRDHWEDLTGVPDGTKPFNSWDHFVNDENEILPLCETKIKAAFAWESHEDPEP